MSMTLHDSRENDKENPSRTTSSTGRSARKCLPSSHNTNCKEFGLAFCSRGRHSSNETGKEGFETWLAPGTDTRLGIKRAVNDSNSDTKLKHTQVHILVPLGLSFT